jgi:hypothetical protein
LLTPWRDSAKLELEALTKRSRWEVVPKSDATSAILPGTWVFRRKRTPDGTIKKLSIKDQEKRQMRKKIRNKKYEQHLLTWLDYAVSKKDQSGIM